MRNKIPIIACQPMKYNNRITTVTNSNTGNNAVHIHLGASSILWTSFDIRSITFPVVVFRRSCWLIRGIWRQIETVIINMRPKSECLIQILRCTLFSMVENFLSKFDFVRDKYNKSDFLTQLWVSWAMLYWSRNLSDVFSFHSSGQRNLTLNRCYSQPAKAIFMANFRINWTRLLLML